MKQVKRMKGLLRSQLCKYCHVYGGYKPKKASSLANEPRALIISAKGLLNIHVALHYVDNK